MTSQEVKRKLTAIFSADVKGYSRLMGENEVQTLKTLSAYFEVMTTLIQKHQGKVLNIAGDNLLADFDSVVDAAQCGVEIQKELGIRNAELAEGQRVEFRIGINLGDVIREGESIYGDGVNIAARLESLSEPGGICISGTAFDQVRNKVDLGYEYLGEQTVKNIVLPVRVYKVLMEPEAAGKVIGEKKVKPRQWKSAAIGLMVFVIVIIAAIVIWKLYTPSIPQPEVATEEKITVAPSEKPPVTVATSPAPSVEPALKEKVKPPSPEKVAKPATPPAPKIEVASKEKMAFPLPDKPSIAVLPFVNMSGDPKQEFLCDGMTEEITTALSKVRQLFVISRQSTFSYKGKPVKVKQVSEELGVRYVLEGSVQRSGDRIRINAQLIDALKGHHIWAERYDRDLTDLFALQDDITIKVLKAIQVKLTEGEFVFRAEKYFRGKQGRDCYLKMVEARSYLRGFNIDDIRVARRLVEEMVEMCPENPMSYVMLASVHLLEYWVGTGKSPRESMEKGMELAQKALAMDDSLWAVHGILSRFYTMKREYEKSIAEGERAVALDPGGAEANLIYGASLTFGGRPEEAIPVLQKSLRLDPLGSPSTFLQLGQALRITGKFEEAVSAFRKTLQRAPDNIIAHIALATTYSMMGREEEAHAEAAEVLRINPKFSVDSYAKRLTFKDQSVTDKSIDALRKAGLK
jgi:TolB-like protein/class 3 adenylate cyclase/Tfp pilus assembly protein PilF